MKDIQGGWGRELGEEVELSSVRGRLGPELSSYELRGKEAGSISVPA